MNEKTIEYVNPETGEILTGTMNDVATKLGINRTTLYRRMNSNDASNVAQVKPETIQMMHNPQMMHEKTNEVTSNVALVHSNDADDIEPSDEQSVEVGQPKTNRYVPDGATVTNDGKIILAKGPCIHCGLPVYHRLKGQYQCFNTCTKQPKKVNTVKISKERTAMFKMMKETFGVNAVKA